MEDQLNNDAHLAVKKQWGDMQLYFIASGDINVTKHIKAVHEGTGHYKTPASGKLFVTPKGNTGTTITFKGAPRHNKSSCIS